MANVNNPKGFTVARSNSVIVPMVRGIVGSNVSLADGDLITMLTTGLIALATGSSTTIHGLCVTAITAKATAQQTISYVPALETIEFEGQCSGTMAQTDIGEAVDIEGGTGAMMVNEDANSTVVIRITGLGNGLANAIGQYARVRFVVNKSSYTGQA